jgi:hypothetical protein
MVAGVRWRAQSPAIFEGGEIEADRSRGPVSATAAEKEKRGLQ